jgi:protein-tyrosine phosphatase
MSPPTDAPLDSPLHIDWLDIPAPRAEVTGRLGMTILPGKHGASVRYPGRVYRRDLDADLETLARADVSRLILLVEDQELERWGDREIVARAARHGVEVYRVPLPDGGAPATPAEMDEIVSLVDGGRHDGNVVVACMGGVGRTGTVAACALVAVGIAAPVAIATVRRARHPTAVETAEQQAFVMSYARARAVGRDDRPVSDPPRAG